MTASPDVPPGGRSSATSTVPARNASAASAAATACNCSGTSGRRSAQVRAHFAGVTPGTYPTVRQSGVTASGYRWAPPISSSHEQAERPVHETRHGGEEAGRVLACHACEVPGDPDYPRRARRPTGGSAAVAQGPPQERPAPEEPSGSQAGRLDRRSRAQRHHRCAHHRADQSAARGEARVACRGTRELPERVARGATLEGAACGPGPRELI